MLEATLSFNYAGKKQEISYLHREGANSIVFIHGGGCTKEDFDKAFSIPTLNDYGLLMFDLPGCGNSSYPLDKPYTIKDYIEISYQVISMIVKGPVVLVGHSLGGLVALYLTDRLPNVEGFLSIEGNLRLESCLFSKKISQTSYQKFTTELFPNLIKASKDSPFLGYQIWAKSLAQANPKAFYDVCKTLVELSSNPQTFDKFIKLSIPKLYLYGEHSKDTLTFLDTLNQHQIPTKQTPNAEHFLVTDNSDFFYQTLSSFITPLPQDTHKST